MKRILVVGVVTLMLVIGVLLLNLYFKENKGNDMAQKNITGLPSPSVTPSVTPSGTALTVLGLGNNFKSVTNVSYGFEVTVPSKYELSGDSNNFTLGIAGKDNRAANFDESEIQFTIVGLKGKSLYEAAKAEYQDSVEGQGQTPDFNEVKKISAGEASGYYWSCPFLRSQTCIYLPLKSSTDKYLSVLKTYADPHSLGYNAELDAILASFRYK